jgi:hypothetical protein
MLPAQLPRDHVSQGNRREHASLTVGDKNFIHRSLISRRYNGGRHLPGSPACLPSSSIKAGEVRSLALGRRRERLREHVVERIEAGLVIGNQHTRAILNAARSAAQDETRAHLARALDELLDADTEPDVQRGTFARMMYGETKLPTRRTLQLAFNRLQRGQ